MVRFLISNGGRGGLAEQLEDDLLPRPLNTIDELQALCERLEQEPVFKKQLVFISVT